MKHLILLAILLVLVTACEVAPPITETNTPAVSAPVSAPISGDTGKPETKLVPLAWGTAHPSWDKALYDAIDALPTAGVAKLKTPCKVLDTRDCAAQLLSIIAKRESNFKPETKYNETGHLQGVVSRGLFQISKDSANQSAYGCNITSAEQLHEPTINIKCAVRILAYQAVKTGTLIDGTDKGGCGRYWSVCRSKNGTSKSYKEIMQYMSQF